VPSDEKVMVWFALAICAVAVEVSGVEPAELAASTLSFKYWPTSAVTKV
jgi:dimeric dUTPase (all-alpha-NTP-PPase superfamily)